MANCIDCSKKTKIHCIGLCRKCYFRRRRIKEKSGEGWWKNIDITQAEKNDLRLVLLRFRWSCESALDIMKVVHYYLKFKSEKMPTYDLYNTEETYKKMRQHLKKIFI